ncbi:MAG: ABC transporter permease subunit [Anaerolineales bacterium]|nr:ABC transporter permease subunit [Anaerolineales bacterium]
MHSKTKQQLLADALQLARTALERGDKHEVRRQARYASRLDPACEEAWLMLAYVSEPKAGLAYVQRALDSHPDSTAAKEAQRWIVNRLPPQDAGRMERSLAASEKMERHVQSGIDAFDRTTDRSTGKKQASAPAEFDAARQVRRSSFFRDTWRAFKRNKAAVAGLVIVSLFLMLAIFPQVFTPYEPTEISFRNIRVPPGTAFEADAEQLARCHWVNTPLESLCSIYIAGSDAVGGDLFSRTVYAARTSLSVAIVASAVSLLIGITYGTISGYAGGRVDEAMMRFVDFLYSIPVFLIVLGIQSMFSRFWLPQEGPFAVLAALNNKTGGLLFLFIAIGAVNWVGMARLARAMVHTQKQREYIEAARSLGANDVQIIIRHLIPNIIGPLLVMETINIPGYIFLEATLSFIGLGVLVMTRGGAQGLNIPSWGVMIRDGYTGIRSSPFLVLFPSAALSLLTLGFNFLGDGLRDAIDPKQRKNGH